MEIIKDYNNNEFHGITSVKIKTNTITYLVIDTEEMGGLLLRTLEPGEYRNEYRFCAEKLFIYKKQYYLLVEQDDYAILLQHANCYQMAINDIIAAHA